MGNQRSTWPTDGIDAWWISWKPFVYNKSKIFQTYFQGFVAPPLTTMLPPAPFRIGTKGALLWYTFVSVFTSKDCFYLVKGGLLQIQYYRLKLEEFNPDRHRCNITIFTVPSWDVAYFAHWDVNGADGWTTTTIKFHEDRTEPMRLNIACHLLYKEIFIIVDALRYVKSEEYLSRCPFYTDPEPIPEPESNANEYPQWIQKLSWWYNWATPENLVGLACLYSMLCIMSAAFSYCFGYCSPNDTRARRENVNPRHRRRKDDKYRRRSSTVTLM